MTPKEKAKDLFNKFNDATMAYDSGDHTAKGINDSIMVMVRESKRCATISVDETIKVIKSIKCKLSNLGMWSYCDKKSFDEIIDFNEQVKKEIENL